MGALTSNRKRGDEYFSSPEFHFSKKLKFSSMNQSTDNNNFDFQKSLFLSTSTASRISRYPDTKPQFRRQVHAPVRTLKFGLKPCAFGAARSTSTSSSVRDEQPPNLDMGNSLSAKLRNAKQNAFNVFRFFVGGDSGKRNDVAKEEVVLSDDDDDDDVEIIEKDAQQNAAVVERPPVSTDKGINLTTEDPPRVLASLALEQSVGVSSVEAYKKLLESAERRDAKLKDLHFEIQFNETKRDSLRALRPVKTPAEPVVKIPPEPFIELTEDEVAQVKQAFSQRRKVLVTHKNSGIDITGQILQCLGPGQWLNDEVINVYLELLKERENREPKKFLKCHFFNTFFYNKLKSGGFKAVKRWTSIKKLGYQLIDCEKIFVPIHRQIHWCLAIINVKDQKFQYLDSLMGRDPEVLRALASYYVEEVKDKSGKVIDVSSWGREFVQELPEQENGFDCGMFMLKYADFYSRGLGLCFEQAHMPYFRLRTAKEILRLKAD